MLYIPFSNPHSPFLLGLPRVLESEFLPQTSSCLDASPTQSCLRRYPGMVSNIYLRLEMQLCLQFLKTVYDEWFQLSFLQFELHSSSPPSISSTCRETGPLTSQVQLLTLSCLSNEGLDLEGVLPEAIAMEYC